jgi:predicted O-methyltransferase YrrM
MELTDDKIHQKHFDRVDMYKQYFKDKYKIASMYKYNSIIEIGVHVGYSALAFLLINPKASYVGFDNNSYKEKCDYTEGECEWLQWAKQNLAPYNCKIIVADTQKLKTFGLTADLIHVDGEHTAIGVYRDLKLALKALNKDGIIIVDDYDYLTCIRRGINRFLKEHPQCHHEYVKTVRGDIIIRC